MALAGQRWWRHKGMTEQLGIMRKIMLRNQVQVVRGRHQISEKHLPSKKITGYLLEEDHFHLAFDSPCYEMPLLACSNCVSDPGLCNHVIFIPKLLVRYWFSMTLQQTNVLCFCSSVAQLCPILCDPTDCSTPGFPVLHYLPEFAQTHVHWVDDAIQPAHPLPPSSPPALSLSQHQSLFQWVGSLCQVA